MRNDEPRAIGERSPDRENGRAPELVDDAWTGSAIRRSEDLFAKAFHGSPAPMTIALRSDGRYIEANRSFLDLVEYRREEVIGRTGLELDLIGPEERARVRRIIQEQGSVHELEVDARTKSGRPLRLLTSIENTDLDGELCTLATMLDVTERRRAEQTLRESEERFRSVFEATSDAVFVRDQTDRFVEVNSVAVQRYGYSREELLRMSPRDLTIPHMLPMLESLGQQAIATQLPFESRHVRKDGSEFPVEVIACPFVMHGRPHVYTSCRDISERKRAQEQTDRLESQLRQAQKMEAVGQLAGGIAHDFNNILAAMILQLELLKHEPSPRVRAAVDEMLDSAHRAADLTRQLLLFGRRQAMKTTTHDVNVVVGGVTKLLGRLLGEPISLTLDLDPSLLWIHGDAGMIEQVVTNLCVNARDSMPRGGQLRISTRAVTLDAAQAGGVPTAHVGPYVCIEVSDTGDGIAPELLGHIFEPFFTTKAVGKGTGLGLATVDGIVTKHGGFVQVKSAPGEGTTFGVYLPSAAPPDAARVTSEPGAAPRGRERILVVEDEAALRRMLLLCLRQLGYEVSEAKSGPDALKVWEERRGDFDLLITDMVMPEGLSGLDVCVRLKRLRSTPKTIITSGYSAELIDDAHMAELDATYLGKPYSVDALAAAVRGRLDERQVQRAIVSNA